MKKRKAFNMIELIFVIIIVGILSVVALPKMSSIQKAASTQVVETFVGTVNSFAFPSMYLATKGSIKSLSLLDYVSSIPIQITSIDITSCGTGTFEPIGQTVIGVTIYCRDGNSTQPPLLSFSHTDYNGSL